MANLADLKNQINLKQFLPEALSIQIHKGMARCPWHDDDTPSLQVNKRYAYCHGCERRGDVFDIVAASTQRNLPESVKFVREHLGIASERDFAPPLTEQECRHEAMQIALWSEAGKATLAYIRSRGFKDSAIRSIGFGHRPGEWSLAIPLFDWRQRVTGHKYRITTEGKPKYLHEAGFKHRLIPYVPANPTSLFVIVEGELDAAMLCAHGVAAGALGTCIVKPEYLKQISQRGFRDIALCLDADKANEQREFFEQHFMHHNLFPLSTPPEWKDPCEWVAEKGVAELLSRCAHTCSRTEHIRSKLLSALVHLY